MSTNYRLLTPGDGERLEHSTLVYIFNTKKLQ